MHNLFLIYFVNLYTFRAYLDPPSGGTTVCIEQLVLIILFRWLSVVLVGLDLLGLTILWNDCLLSWLDWTYWDLLFFSNGCLLSLLDWTYWDLLFFLDDCLLSWMDWTYWDLLFFLDDCLLSWMESIQDNRQSSKKNNKYQLLYTYGCTSWWWA
jgi:hypothetical protein